LHQKERLIEALNGCNGRIEATKKTLARTERSKAMLTREQLIREYEARSGSLSGLVVFYVGLIAVLVLTASAII
tara:strand:+ start:1762 stop:1983 length:222 start_codon:yes stop_codon:yes gene_type:complete